MAYIAVEVDGELVSQRYSTFGDDEFLEDAAERLAGNNLRGHVKKSSRERRKKK